MIIKCSFCNRHLSCCEISINSIEQNITTIKHLLQSDPLNDVFIIYRLRISSCVMSFRWYLICSLVISKSITINTTIRRLNTLEMNSPICDSLSDDLKVLATWSVLAHLNPWLNVASSCIYTSVSLILITVIRSIHLKMWSFRHFGIVPLLPINGFPQLYSIRSEIVTTSFILAI